MVIIEILSAFIEFFRGFFIRELPDNPYMDYLLSEPGLLEEHKKIWRNE